MLPLTNAAAHNSIILAGIHDGGPKDNHLLTLLDNRNTVINY
jgi:hypothetical protein